MIQLYRRLTTTIVATLCAAALLAQPTITSFTPASGPAGTSLTITGSNFNTTPDNNYVWFGGIKGKVTAATATQLTVTVPAGATYDPISVLNQGTRLIGYSNKAFLQTFNGGATNQTIINPTRNAPVNFPMGGPEAPLTADIDGDGKPDIIVNQGNSAGVFRNTSTPGTIDYTSLAAVVNFYAGQGASNLVIRDLNGDGKPDLVCSSNQNNFHAYISVNTSTPGHISFAAAQAYAFSGGFIDATDMDGDGRPDLVMAFQGGVALWLNTTAPGGALTFANPVTYGISGNTADLSVIDIDGDGKPDVVCANGSDKTISILHNTITAIGVVNSSSFAPYLSLPTNRAANCFTIRDIDADGKPDVVIGTDSGIAILKNIATPGSITAASFATEVDIPVYAGISGVAVADIDGDGKPDITTSSLVPYGGFASILKNIGTPGTISAASFAQHTDIHAGGWGYGVFAADVDGDGRPEIIVSNTHTPSGISIIRPVINTQAPTLTGISPDSATIGQTVTIKGRNLSGTTAVSFGGTPAANFTTLSDTTITATLGNGATGNIGVTTGLGTATLPGFYYILAPAITNFTPATAGRGDTVIITGSRFTDADTVTFGGISATWFTVTGDNTIKALIGNNGATGNLVIKTPFGTGTATGFTYKPYPLITSFTPVFGKTGDAISIHGKYLTGATAVSFGGVAAGSFTVVSDTVVTGIVGNGGIGAINITTAQLSAGLEQFTYIYAAPTITGFSPASGAAGTTVTITGSGFDPIPANNVVYFGGGKAVVTQASAGSLTVTVPTSATFAPLTVTTHRKTVYNKTFRLTFAGGGSITTSSFGAMAQVATGYSETLVDADGDGKLDIANQTGQLVSIIPNNSTSTTLSFGAPAGATVSYAPQPLSFADIDGDGRPDIANGYSDGYPMIIFANTSTKGKPALLPGVSFRGTALDREVIGIADFNQDGKPDIAASGNYTNAVAIETNTSLNSTFAFGAETTAPIGQGPVATLVDDFDGDGKTDIVVDGSYVSYIYAFRNTSPVGGTISFATQASKYDYGIQQMVEGDIDGDGKPDLIAGMLDKTIHVYLNTSTPGTISFAAPIVLPALGGVPGYLAMADLDGDGKLDFVTSETTTRTLYVYHNSSTVGAPNFDPAVTFATDAAPGMVAIGDINGDGKPDIVLNANGKHYVYLNQITAPNAPTITAFTPATAGPGATITITGTNLTGATSVTFGGTPAAGFTVNSGNSITATLGAGASGSVMVTTPNGSASLDALVYNYPAPHITAFTPAHAAAGTTITIIGTNLDGVTNITFGGVPASSFAIMSSTTITALIAPGSASGSVALFGSAGNDSLTGFTFILPPPTITGFTPASAKPGTAVTITGTGFTGTTSVTFGGTPATSYTVNSDNSITAIVAATGSTGSITITSPQGTVSSGSAFTYTPILFQITSFSPTTAGPGQQVTIVGSKLDGAGSITFGGTLSPSFTIVSPDTIIATVGSGASGSVTVINQSTQTSLGGFTFAAPASTLTSFSPGSATTNMTVAIMGTHLTGATAVSFGGTAAQSFTVISDNEIDAVVGSGATGNVVVTMPGGPLTLAGFPFTQYIIAPTLTSMNPTSANQGTQVSLFGGGFTGTTSVTFGGVPAAGFTVVSDGVIHAIIGTGASGNVVVTNPMGSSQIAGFIWHPLPPTLTFVNPATGTANETITLHGTNLSTATSVVIGSGLGAFYALNVTVLSDTTVSCTINPLSQSGSITIYTAGGSASLANFTIAPAGTPSISSISPTSGPAGTVVTINGVNLGNTNSVSFGGVYATSYTVISSTQITATVGQGATGSVIAYSSIGNASFNGFTYTGTTQPSIQRPLVFTFTPTHAKQGDIVTLTGLHLDSTAFVTFGGVAAASFHATGDTVIKAVVGTGATGNIIVTNTVGRDTLYGFVFDTTAVVTPPDTTHPTPPVTPPDTTNPPPVTPPDTTNPNPPGDTTHLNPPGDTTPPAPPPAFALAGFAGAVVANQPVLTWKALHEQHIAYYGIEQGADTLHWTTVTLLPAREQDSATYSYTDTATRSGVNFYRLSVVKNAGDSTFSNVIVVQLAGAPATLSLYPNPSTTGWILVDVPVISSPSQFQIVDLAGNIVQTAPVAAGTTQTKLYVATLLKGVYKIIWYNGNQSAYRTVLIMK